MATSPYSTALIVGAGPGLGASLARIFARDGGLQVIVAARHPEKLEANAKETGAVAMTCNASDPAALDALSEKAAQHFGAAPEVVVYHASQRVRSALVDVDPHAVSEALSVTAYGAFLVAQRAARGMLPAGKGAILLTGASAGVKGYPRSAAFAMGKFALRGLAQSMARGLAPQGIHVGHVVIDGAIGPASSSKDRTSEDQLDPDAIASTYLHLLDQPRNAWTWEMELRPSVEKF